MFTKMNVGLRKFDHWFKANKLSLNADKTKFTLFHKTSQSENLPLKLPNNKQISDKVKSDIGIYPVEYHIARLDKFYVRF